MVNDKPIAGACVAGSDRFGLEAEQRNGGQGQRAGEVHRVLLPMSGRRRPTTATCTATSSSKTARRSRKRRSAHWNSTDPTDLWKWMDEQRQAGNELLAISHNANLSDGHMFPIDVDQKGRPIDAAWAASRDRNEHLTEIKQIKGQSETHPVLSPNDEFANYELLNYLLGNPDGRTPHDSRKLRASGPQGRPDDAGDQGLQSLQPGLCRRVGLAQHRRALPPGQFLRRPRSQRRQHQGAHVGPCVCRPRRTL